MSEGERIAADVYWRQEHEPRGKYRMARLAELIDEAIRKSIASTKEQCARVARTAALEWKGEHGRSVAYAIEDAIRSLQITGEGK